MLIHESNNILSIIAKITEALRENKIEVEVSYRLKHPKSILEKMMTKEIGFHEIKDLVAFRFIVQRIKDCYKLEDIIRQIHVANMVEKEDYIANPKVNGYRSLHIVISDNELMRNVEIQIRTKKMHKVAEIGSASHSHYKSEIREKIGALFSSMLNEFTTGKAYDIWHNFQWTVPELATYETEIKEILHRARYTLLNEELLVIKS